MFWRSPLWTPTNIIIIGLFALIARFILAKAINALDGASGSAAGPAY